MLTRKARSASEVTRIGYLSARTPPWSHWWPTPSISTERARRRKLGVRQWALLHLKSSVERHLSRQDLRWLTRFLIGEEK